MDTILDGKKTILVVEDNDSVRGMTARVLEMSGYSVMEACHGRDALAICTYLKEPIDLILTDIVMPYMTGPEFIERVRRVRNDFKVLFMSGFVDDAIVQRMISEREINFIAKPFHIPDLLDKVNDVLGMGGMNNIASF